MTSYVAVCLAALAVLSFLTSDEGENVSFMNYASLLSTGLIYTNTTDADVFTNGYPLHCSPLIYTDVTCCSLFLVTIFVTILVILRRILYCVFLTHYFGKRLVVHYNLNCAYAKLPVQRLSSAQRSQFQDNSLQGFNGQFVLDQPRVKPFAIDQVASFLLDEAGPKILWLALNDFYLWSRSTKGYEFKPVLKLRCHLEADFVWLFHRKDGDFDVDICRPIVDLLMSLGTASGYFEIHGMSSELKTLFSSAGLEAFLRESPNISTLQFNDMYIDNECCSILGNLGHSPLALIFTRCKFESPEALSNGMRQNGGPTELIYTGAASSGNTLWKSFGSLDTNTKLQSILSKDFQCAHKDELKGILSTLSARDLRRIEFNASRGQSFTPHTWIVFWEFLSSHPSVTSVHLIDTGDYDLAPIADALCGNFIITTITLKKRVEDDAFWKERVHRALKRNRNLTHLSRVYHLIQEHPHSLAHVAWKVDRAADSADRGSVLVNASQDE
jgi:hypothetical protein